MRRIDLVFVDLFLIVAASTFALMLRDNFDVSRDRLVTLSPYLVSTLVVGAGVIPAMGINRSVWRFTSIADCFKILVATCAIVLGAVALAFCINRLDGVARALPVLQAILIIFALIGARVLLRLRHLLRNRPPRPEMPSLRACGESVLVVGFGKLAELFLQSVAELASDRLRIAGVLGRTDRHTGRLMHGHQVLGTPHQIAAVLRDLEVHGVLVDRIVVCTAFQSLPPQARKALLEIEKTTTIAVDFLAERMGLAGKDLRAGQEPSSSSSPIENRPSATRDSNLRLAAQRPFWRVKRAFDIAAAVALLVALAPLFLIAAALVAVDIGAPVWFWQQRPGKGGWPFRLYKFRTMAAAHDDCGERLADEERLSAIGGFLRRTRLDELPQLLNILIGEMSFVGPRPLLPVDQPEADHPRLLVRPGLTGWAQVHGGREISVDDKATLDLWYIKNASFGLDARILLRTVIMLLRGEDRNEGMIQKAYSDLGIGRRGETAEVHAATAGAVLAQAAKRAAL